MMRGLGWTSAKLAIFTIVTVATTTWLAAIIGNFSLFGDRFEIAAEFSDATGLLKGDVVKAAGVTIGRVSDIQIDDGLAIVTMSIDEDAELPADLGAEIRFRNLVGQRMVTLVPSKDAAAGGLVAAGAARAQPMEPGALIPLSRTQPAFDLTELFNGLRPIIHSTNPEDVNTVTRELLAALRGRSGAVEEIFANLAEISDELASKDRELATLLENLHVVTDDLAGRDAQLRTTLADLNTFLAELSASQDDLEAALVNLDDAAQRLGRIITNNDDLIKREIDDLSVILDAVNAKRRDLRAALRSLPEFTIAVERVTQYGEWANQHLITVCKDDFGTCGRRGGP
jgi:phospholipid/cholesterol/gamma-HCH transport system substrate-binding protein